MRAEAVRTMYLLFPLQQVSVNDTISIQWTAEERPMKYSLHRCIADGAAEINLASVRFQRVGNCFHNRHSRQKVMIRGNLIGDANRTIRRDSDPRMIERMLLY